MPSKKSLVAITVVAIIIIGLGIYAYQLMTIANSISAETSVESASLIGFNPPYDPIPDGLKLTIKAVVTNPTSYSVEVDRLIYKVYIEDKYLGEGVKENIYIPGNSETPIYLDFTSKTSDIINILRDLISRGDKAIDYKIDVILTIPVKLFGVIRISSVNVPYEKTGYYILPIPVGKTQIKGVNAYWKSTEASVASNVTLIVKIPAGLEGNLEVVVMKDVPVLPDQEVSRLDYGYIKGPKIMTFTFTPTEASSITLKGYYIKLILNGQEIFVQQDGYPPRLRIH